MNATFSRSTSTSGWNVYSMGGRMHLTQAFYERPCPWILSISTTSIKAFWACLGLPKSSQAEPKQTSRLTLIILGSATFNLHYISILLAILSRCFHLMALWRVERKLGKYFQHSLKSMGHDDYRTLSYFIFLFLFFFFYMTDYFYMTWDSTNILIIDHESKLDSHLFNLKTLSINAWLLPLQPRNSRSMLDSHLFNCETLDWCLTPTSSTAKLLIDAQLLPLLWLILGWHLRPLRKNQESTSNVPWKVSDMMTIVLWVISFFFFFSSSFTSLIACSISTWPETVPTF